MHSDYTSMISIRLFDYAATIYVFEQKILGIILASNIVIKIAGKHPSNRNRILDLLNQTNTEKTLYENECRSIYKTYDFNSFITVGSSEEITHKHSFSVAIKYSLEELCTMLPKPISCFIQ